MGDALIFCGCGAFFLACAAWLRSHEHWSLTSDRLGYESRPTAFRRLNYRVSSLLNHVVVPIALAALGVTAIVMGVGSLW